MNITSLNLGWECPKCHRCYAPHVCECAVCNSNYLNMPYNIVPELVCCPVCFTWYVDSQGHGCSGINPTYTGNVE